MSGDYYFQTDLGRMVCNDSALELDIMADCSVDLVATSPPYALVREKEYGNVSESEWVEWFRPFAEQIHRVLKPSGSFVLDLGGAWNQGTPTRSLYQFRALLMLVDDLGFHLAQDFWWWNPAKLPSPAEWVTIRRVRVKDAVNTVWWLSKTEWPKASNERVLAPYAASPSNGRAQKTTAPSEHDISPGNWHVEGGGSIAPNLLAAANTESNGGYQRWCASKGVDPHPARWPAAIPEFFVRMTTDPGDLVVDPFAGSCTTGEVCERLGRRWVCVDENESYLFGSIGRFKKVKTEMEGQGQLFDRGRSRPVAPPSGRYSHSVPCPQSVWGLSTEGDLDPDGGRARMAISDSQVTK